MSLVDTNTVALVETLSPYYSSLDAARITDLMQTRQIFPLITDMTRRERILRKMLAVKGRILSVYTYIEDTKILEIIWKIRRQLSPDHLRASKRSLREAFPGLPLLLQCGQSNRRSGTFALRPGTRTRVTRGRSRGCDMGQLRPMRARRISKLYRLERHFF